MAGKNYPKIPYIPVLPIRVNDVGKICPFSILCRWTQWTTFVPELILECAHTGRYKFLNIFTKKALCWIWSSYFKKFWSPNGNESGVDFRIKLFTMSFYTTYWKYKFFQRHLRVKAVRVEKYAIKTRKMCISAEINIQKFLFYCLIILRINAVQ